MLAARVIQHCGEQRLSYLVPLVFLLYAHRVEFSGAGAGFLKGCEAPYNVAVHICPDGHQAALRSDFVDGLPALCLFGEGAEYFFYHGFFFCTARWAA